MRRTILAVALLMLFSLPSAAQQSVKVSFQDNGRVTVEATQATVRAILTEWAKQGGTKVVGVERVTGAPVTIKLVNVPEAQALESILRSVAGYMAAPRHAAATGPSVYDRIMIMATTSAPPPAATRAAQPNTNNSFNGTQRFVPPRGREEQREADEQDEPDENPPSPPVFTFPQPGQQNGFQPPFQQPFGGQFNGAPGNQQPVIINPATGTAQPAAPYQPGMPIGVSTPGMMVNPPQPQQPTTPTTTVPGQMIRPPGQRQQ
jgi:hypothetical protein